MEKLIGVMGILYLFLIACNNENREKIDANSNAISETAHVEAASQIEAGRYLAIVAGCNDCHTHEYLMREGQIPE